MSTPYDSDAGPDAGLSPAFPAPAGACDAHFHVFGREAQYPYDHSDLRYKPPYEPLDAYMKLARRIGFQRFVLVQPSAYGMDNSCMLDAMRATDPAIRRGIVHLDERTATDAEIASLDALGVRGVRVNFSPLAKPEGGLSDAVAPRLKALAKRLKPFGWQLDLLMPGWLISELMPTLAALDLRYSVAHLGLYPAKNGARQPGFQQFVALVGDGSKRVFVKLTGIYRFSTDPTFADVAPFAAELIARVPDQLIWGSDFPHLSFDDKVGSIMLYNKLGEWAKDDVMRRRILTDNPARLYGFA